MKYARCVLSFLALLVLLPVQAQELKPLALPSPQTDIGKPLMEVLRLRQSSRSFAATPIPLQELSNLLWAASGVNRAESGRRTAPSAMNWQEIDVFVALSDALYLYDARNNTLKPVVAVDLRESTGKQPFVKDAPLNLIYVADGAKMKNASEDDRMLYSSADAGFIAQNVYLYCASQGFAVVVRGMIDRPALAAKMKLRPDQRIVLAQTVGYAK